MVRGNHCLFNYVADYLTTELFILTLSRLFARKRHVKITASYNGRNFIGGEFELRALNSDNITWKFNPPRWSEHYMQYPLKEYLQTEPCKHIYVSRIHSQQTFCESFKERSYYYHIKRCTSFTLVISQNSRHIYR